MIFLYSSQRIFGHLIWWSLLLYFFFTSLGTCWSVRKGYCLGLGTSLISFASYLAWTLENRPHIYPWRFGKFLRKSSAAVEFLFRLNNIPSSVWVCLDDWPGFFVLSSAWKDPVDVRTGLSSCLCFNIDIYEIMYSSGFLFAIKRTGRSRICSC